jgi:hypothetical protein
MIVNDEEQIVARSRDRGQSQLEIVQLEASEAGGEH